MAGGPVFAAQLQHWIAQVVCDRSLWKHSTATRLAMLIAAHLNRKTFEAFPSQRRLAGLLGVREEAVRRAALVLKECGHLSFEPGRGQGIATRYRPVLQIENPLSQEEGFSSVDAAAGNPSSNAPKPLSQEEGGTIRTLSTPRFARSGPTGGAVGPHAGETLIEFTWRMAKAFPPKRGGVPQAAADLRAFIETGGTTREEIESAVTRWRPYFDWCRAENGHATGYTMRGWLESGDFRSKPSEIHSGAPDDSSEEFA